MTHVDDAERDTPEASRIARLERRLARERAARDEAERIAERGMRDLWHLNSDLEARVSERTAELERSLRATTMAAEAKERFLAELGHELTTPLHAVMGLLELIDSSALAVEDQDRLDAIRENASELSSMLHALVELAGAEGASAPDDIVELRPTRWLDDVVASWTRPAAMRGQLLVPSIEGSDEPVRLDWRRLRRVIDAVLSNVTDHADSGSVEIIVRCDSDRVALAVSDSGPGMGAEALAAIVDPFVHFRGARRVGVGLAVAHRLAVVGGGALTVTSDGSSTTATCFLPRV